MCIMCLIIYLLYLFTEYIPGLVTGLYIAWYQYSTPLIYIHTRISVV